VGWRFSPVSSILLPVKIKTKINIDVDALNATRISCAEFAEVVSGVFRVGAQLILRKEQIPE
jgi:hypothetical protein